MRKHEGPSTKSLDLDENFKYQHTLFCRDIKICGDLRTILKTLGKKSFLLGQKLYILDKKCTITLYIAYSTELNLQTCNSAQKRRIFRENSKYAPDEFFLAIFALAERLPTSATLLPIQIRKSQHKKATKPVHQYIPISEKREM